MSMFRTETLAEYFSYLDGLRGSGATNMFGAVPYLVGSYSGLTKAEAKKVLSAWMTTFDSESSAEERAEKYLSS